MSATASLYYVAANGSNNYHQVEPLKNPLINHLLARFAEADLPRQLLLMVGTESLFHRAGYVPSSKKHAIQKLFSPDEGSQQAFNKKAIRFLARLHWGEYSAAFNEWVHYFSISEAILPGEAIPLVLNLATRFPQTRGMAMRVIGERGRWLVDACTNSRWQWTLMTQAEKPRFIKYRKHEIRVLSNLNKFQYINAETINENDLNHPWSPYFSEKLLQQWNGSLKRFPPTNLIDIVLFLEKVKYFIDPELREVLFEIMHQHLPIDWDNMPKHLLVVKQLLAFRAEMCLSLQETSPL